MKLLWRFVLASVPVWAQVNVPAINQAPSREFGQAHLDSPVKSQAPNLVEGRELNGPSGIAFDTSVTPPILYVADTFNSRVLAWRNPAGLTRGNPADLVIGQRDQYTTITQGPGRSGSDLPSGLSRPVGLAVDGSGNLYVMDAANNRILRYPAPFSQTGGVFSADLVIGQTSTTSGIQPNEGKPVSASTLFLAVTSSGLFVGGIAFDPQGNLWATDIGNHRVLRFPSSLLKQSPPPKEPPADVVIGQKDFFSNVNPDNVSSDNPKTASVLRYPISLGMDPSGAMYVADSYGRVLYFSSPGPANSQPGLADRILGIPPDPVQGQPPLLFPNQYSVSGGNQLGQNTGSPQCVFTYQGKVFVCDTTAHRVVRYDSPAQWIPATTSALSPAIVTVVGQPDLTNGCTGARAQCTLPNRGLAEPDATTLNTPVAGAFDPSGNLWICDTGNHRVLSYPASSLYSYSSASTVLGQIDSSASQADAFHHDAPNLVEGREVWIYNNTSLGGAIVVDKNANPPHLYIADTYNNRILGFNDARVVGADVRSVLTTKADIVIGQPDLFRTTPNCTVTALNSPCTGDPQTPNDTGLSLPVGIALDAQGNLYVADSTNGRVVRFPAPFANPSGIQRANLVLGQFSFGQPNLTTSQNTMRSPFGVVVFTDGNLAVSDSLDNRVLIFRKSGGDFVNGQTASAVVGQPSYSTANAASTAAGLNTPLHIAVDDTDRLYVCDFNNNRVAIFRSETSLTQGDASSTTISISQPTGIALLPPPSRTIWITASAIVHVTNFDNLQGNQNDILQVIQPTSLSAAIAVGLDSFNNLIVAETANRISFYFQQLVYRNAANATSGDKQQVAPGMMMYVTNSLGTITADSTGGNLNPPWLPLVSGLQVLVNGVPAPIFNVAPPLIFIQVPIGAPTSGTSEFLITRPATGEIVAAGTYSMTQAAPGFFTSNAQGTGQIAATNFSDGSVNGPQHPAARGDIITLWLTGQGPGFQGAAPQDGQGASGLLTDVNPVVYVNTQQLPDANVIGSAMTVYPGAWIINIKIPDGPGSPSCAGTAPSCDIPIWVRMRDFYSYFGGTSTIGQDQSLSGTLLTTFRLKQ